MSIKIGINGTASFNALKDLIVGTSQTTKQDVNRVEDWNGTIIWQRKAPDVPMTQENTVITINPTSYNESGSSASWGPYTPSVTKVTVNGVEIGTDKYQIDGYSNNSGTGTVSGQKGKVTISGKNGYSGSVYKEFSISYTQNIEMTQENTTITIDPTSYDESGVSKTWGIYYKPSVTSVKVGSVTLASNQYDVTGYSDHSGTITGMHMIGTRVTGTGKVSISGKNGCTGSAYKEYPVAYTYNPYVVRMAVFTRKSGTTAYTHSDALLFVLGSNCRINGHNEINGLYYQRVDGYYFIYTDESHDRTITSAHISLLPIGTVLSATVDGFSDTLSTSPTMAGDTITEDTGKTDMHVYVTYTKSS